MKKTLLVACLCTGMVTFAQDSIKTEASVPALTVSGYAEPYFSYDFNKPPLNDKSGFFYSHNRHNEFNLNLGFIRAAYAGERVRANVALAAGTYMNANYAAETGVMKNVFEANAGVKLSPRKNLWLDAGIFSSHIGFESAISKDCWTLTRSIVAENSPYYESGARLSYTTDNNKWLLSALVLNGWQRIKRVDGNSLMSFGTQVQYRPAATTTLNYSTFIGTDKPDSNRLMRYYHNLYAIFNVGNLGVTAGVDIGMEQKMKGQSGTNSWVSPVLMVKYPLSKQWSVAARAEYYEDKYGVIIATLTPNEFRTTGYSINVDYAPISNAVLRLEARMFRSKDAVFLKSSGTSDKDNLITASLAVSF